MCTLIVAFQMFDGFPLVVAANRDELLDRPSERPNYRYTGDLILAPKDSVRGGSWIGVNEYGVFAALTNRLDVKSQPGRMSRGKLVMDALKHQSAHSAYADAFRVDGNNLNGFNMVIADKNEMFLLRGDGKIISRGSQERGLLVVSNHGVGRTITQDPPRRVREVLSLWHRTEIGEQDPTLETLVPLLNIHSEGRHSTCINEPEANYGTKSSSIIRLASDVSGDMWHYWHRERSDRSKHICTDPFESRLDLRINNDPDHNDGWL